MAEGRFKLTDGCILAAFGLLVLPPWAAWLGTRVDLSATLAPFTLRHPLGVDNMGRDLLGRLASAARDSTLPLWLAVSAATCFGLAMGLAAAVARPKFPPLILCLDALLTVVASCPVTIVAFAWAAYFERAGLGSVLISVATIFAFRAYLLIQDLVRQDSQLSYWTAHEATGGRQLARLWYYGVCSHWRAALAANLGLHLRSAVAVEASLSYLGFGVEEPTASFGNILAAHFADTLHGDLTVLIATTVTLGLTAAVPVAASTLLLSLTIPRLHPKKPTLNLAQRQVTSP